MRYEAACKARALEALAARGLDASHRRLVEWVGRGKRVLDIGCATGYIARELAANECVVDGIELDPEAAKAAEKYCTRVYTGEAQELIVTADLGGPYEAAIMGDVLEHLVDPWLTLKALHRHVMPGGRVLITVPNVAFFKMRWALLHGIWEYADLGLCDRTHLRFFTFFSFQATARDCGWKVARYAINDGRLPGGFICLRIPLLKHAFAAVSNWAVQRRPNLFGFHFLFELTRAEP